MTLSMRDYKEALLGRDIAKYNPEEFKNNQSKLAKVIDYAAEVEDSQLLENASREKVLQIAEFVGWWEANVTPHGGGRRGIGVTVLLPQEVKKWKMSVSRWKTALQNEEKFISSIIVAALRKAGLVAAANHRAEGTGENEWHTPEKYILAARKVMGDIDLDPASSELAQRTVKAKNFFTVKENGLDKEWHGRVWLNPPYAQPLILNFTEKLVQEFKAGRTSAAILLVHNYSDTTWWHVAESIAARICFPRGRIKFVNADGDECAPTQGQHFFYYGDDPNAFQGVFSEFGPIR